MKTTIKLILIFIFLLTAFNVLAVGTEKKSPNPLSGNEKSISEGKTLYRANCSYCHGLRANGKGRGLPNSADLRKFKRGYTAFFSTVVNGWKTMPAWGSQGRLEFDQINKIGAYLETIGIKGSNWQDND
jgi:mono/diheme cytochrome c family protein